MGGDFDSSADRALAEVSALVVLLADLAVADRTRREDLARRR